MSEQKNIKFLTFVEAHGILKNGGKVRQKGQKDGIYYFMRGPDDDDCIKKPVVFIHTIDGQLVRASLPAPEDLDEKLFIEVK
jgi:hypothetical protein